MMAKQTGDQVKYEGNLDQISEKNLYNRIAAAVIYAKKIMSKVFSSPVNRETTETKPDWLRFVQL